jgi:hypothetical protein
VIWLVAMEAIGILFVSIVETSGKDIFYSIAFLLCFAVASTTCTFSLLA